MLRWVIGAWLIQDGRPRSRLPGPIWGPRDLGSCRGPTLLPAPHSSHVRTGPRASCVNLWWDGVLHPSSKIWVQRLPILYSSLSISLSSRDGFLTDSIVLTCCATFNSCLIIEGNEYKYYSVRRGYTKCVYGTQTTMLTDYSTYSAELLCYVSRSNVGLWLDMATQYNQFF